MLHPSQSANLHLKCKISAHHNIFSLRSEVQSNLWSRLLRCRLQAGSVESNLPFSQSRATLVSSQLELLLYRVIGE